MSPSSIERFWKRTIPEPNSGCVLWMGDHNEKGYGRFNNKKAHRIAWELAQGPVPTGQHVLHKCDTPGCVNEKHLFLGSHAENMKDRFVKGRYKKTYICKRGHPLEGKNLVLKPHKRRVIRQCRECKNLKQREDYWRKRNGS